eukprot:15470239-Alexandrium_andersonii.AAC.1
MRFCQSAMRAAGPATRRSGCSTSCRARAKGATLTCSRRACSAPTRRRSSCLGLRRAQRGIAGARLSPARVR